MSIPMYLSEYANANGCYFVFKKLGPLKADVTLLFH